MPTAAAAAVQDVGVASAAGAASTAAVPLEVLSSAASLSSLSSLEQDASDCLLTEHSAEMYVQHAEGPAGGTRADAQVSTDPWMGVAAHTLAAAAGTLPQQPSSHPMGSPEMIPGPTPPAQRAADHDAQPPSPTENAGGDTDQGTAHPPCPPPATAADKTEQNATIAVIGLQAPPGRPAEECAASAHNDHSSGPVLSLRGEDGHEDLMQPHLTALPAEGSRIEATEEPALLLLDRGSKELSRQHGQPPSMDSRPCNRSNGSGSADILADARSQSSSGSDSHEYGATTAPVLAQTVGAEGSAAAPLPLLPSVRSGRSPSAAPPPSPPRSLEDDDGFFSPRGPGQGWLLPAPVLPHQEALAHASALEEQLLKGAPCWLGRYLLLSMSINLSCNVYHERWPDVSANGTIHQGVLLIKACCGSRAGTVSGAESRKPEGRTGRAVSGGSRRLATCGPLDRRQHSGRAAAAAHR